MATTASAKEGTRGPPSGGRALGWLRRIDKPRLLRRIGFILLWIAIAVAVLYALGLAGVYDLNYASSILPFRGLALTIGLYTTLTLIAIVIPVGFALGFTFGWGRTSTHWLVRSLSTGYVEFFRGMPPIVLIAFAYLITITILRSIPSIEDPGFIAAQLAVVALAAHSGAYQAEIIRAGILSVPTGQVEAAEAVGMTRGEIRTGVVLPQMIRVSLPALGNEFASVIKDTSLLSAVNALDLTFQGKNLAARLAVGSGNVELVVELWFVVALVYFIITFIVSRGLQAVEKRYRVPGLEAAQL